MILSLLLTSICVLSPSALDGTSPPGLISLRGGRTTVGSSVKEIEKLVEDESEARTLVRALDGTTPQHTQDLAPFHLGMTEVTNEQYAAFVLATGHRPTFDWAEEAIEGARKAYFEEVKRRRDAGEKGFSGKFEPEEWWDANWKGQPWGVPEGDELRPVTRVNYEDVTAYCRWAGLRLMTEFEYQYAVRGKSKDPYPWGDDWEDGAFCATSELRRVSRTFPVGSFAKGASGDGIQDLAGNVWEWTMSPYVAFEGFDKNEYKIPGQRKKVTVPQPKWDGNQRVVVGGSFENSKMAARCTVRRGAERNQMTMALGFRVAATPVPVRDLAEHIWTMDLRNSDGRPSGVTYRLDGVMGIDRWSARSGGEKAPEGYEVITEYEHLAFVPGAEMQEIGDVPFRKASLTEPQHLGFVTLSMPSIEPAMDVGTYMIAFRAAGATEVAEEEETDDEGEGDEEKPKPKRGDIEDPWAAVINVEVDNLLFLNSLTGELVAHQPIEGVVFGKTEGDAGFTPVDKKKMVDDPADPGKKIEITERWMRVKCEVTTRLRRHVLPFKFDLRLEPEFWDKKWRGMGVE